MQDLAAENGPSHQKVHINARVQKCLVGVLRVIFVICNNFYCIPAHLIWLLILQPLRILLPELYWKIEGIFFRWLLSMVALWSYTAGYHIKEVGDNVWQLAQDRTLVMYNHQSTSDVPLIMAAFNCRPMFSSSVMWIMDRVFKMTNFGVVSHMHGDFFIRAGVKHRDSSLLSLREHLRSFYQPRGRKWIVLFPEGGFLVNRKPISQKFGQKLGLPHLQHVSLPRSGALKAILEHSSQQTLQEQIKWVVDVTVAYPGGKPLDLQTLISGWLPPCTVVMHYRCYAADKVPLEESKLNAWMYGRFVEKERMLAEYYDTGLFPDAPSPSYVAPAPLPRNVTLSDTFSHSSYTVPQIAYVIPTNNHTNFVGNPCSESIETRSDFSSVGGESEDCKGSILKKSVANEVHVKPTCNGTCGLNNASSISEVCGPHEAHKLNEHHSQLSNNSRSVATNCCNSIYSDESDYLPDTVNNNSPRHSVSLNMKGMFKSDSLVARDKDMTDTNCHLYPETERPSLGKLPGALLHQDLLELLLLHLFYITSTYVALHVARSAWNTLVQIFC